MAAEVDVCWEDSLRVKGLDCVLEPWWSSVVWLAD